MISFVAHAWRNLARNRRRTAITMSAVALSTATIVLAVALTDGMLEGAVANATNLVVGEVQVHAPGYVEERSFYAALADSERLLSAARARGIEAAARSYGYGLVAQGTRSAGALFWGVNPADEIAAFDLARHVADGAGSFLVPEQRGSLVLGRKLARSLGAKVGSEIVVVVQAGDGSLGNELFLVVGILKAVGDGVDRSAAIMHVADFDDLFVAGGRVHEVVFNTRGRLELAELESIVAALAPADDVRSWRTVLPGLSDMLAMAGSVLWILGAVFFTAAGLGVMNTMLMATYERMHEFGVLKALGTKPWRIVCDVAGEALLLAVAGTAIGAVIGLAAAHWLAIYGIDTASFAGETSFAGVAFDPVWRAVPNYAAAVQAIWLMCLIAVVTSLYPALLAARMRPVDAMRQV